MSQTGNHGMLQQPNVQQHVNLNYPNVPSNQFQQHLGSGEPIVGGENVVHNSMSAPGSSSPWGKNPSQTQQSQVQGNHSHAGMMTPGDIHHPSIRSSNNSSYGASSTFNHFQQSQHCLYSQQQQNSMELRYDSPNGQIRPNSASEYSNVGQNTATSAYYHHHDGDSSRNDCRQQYYPLNPHQHQFPSYDHQQAQSDLKGVGGSCAMMNSSGHGHSGNNNFYGYYNNQNSQYPQQQHQEIYPGSMSSDPSTTSEDFVTNNRTHNNSNSAISNLNRYFDPNHHQARPDGYLYNSSCGYNNSATTHCTISNNNRYGMSTGHYNNNNNSSHNNLHGHHHHPPFRRKSMESYISEPGDIRYNGGNKYGCNFPSQQSQYISPSPSPSSTTPTPATMIKRECLSNPSSSALPVPLPNNGNSADCTTWTPRSDVQMHDPSSHHHEAYLYSTTNSHQDQSNMNMTNISYGNNEITPYANQNQSSTGGSSVCNNDTFHQPQNLPSFKSCAFGGGQSECIKMDTDMKGVSNNYGVKAGSVKHRSLSLSIPSSSYPVGHQMGLPTSSQENFVNEPHLKNHSNESRSDNSPNSSSCCNPMEKGGGESNSMSSNYDCAMESSSTSSMDHQQHYVSSYEGSSIGGSSDVVNQSLHVQGSYNPASNCSNPEECSVVTSCSNEQVHSNDESNHNNHHHHHHQTADCYLASGGESLEKVYSVEDGCESQSESSSSSAVASPNNNADLCSSTPSHCCDEGISHTTDDPSLTSDFGRDLSESDLVIVEKSFENDDDDPPDTDELMLDDKPADSNVISTTTNDILSSGEGHEECDPDCESNSSSCSFSSALFGIKRANSLSCNFGSSDDSCASGGSLTFGGSIGRSDNHHHSSSGGSKLSPQKISKRSFSETDKDIVINTTAISFGGMSMTLDRKMNHGQQHHHHQNHHHHHKNGCGSENNVVTILEGGVPVPKGWKREISYANENHMTVYYVSPSDTKLRSWEELKNYICADGTCKCGLSCPLRLESAFSFDPKVISLCIEKTEEDQDNHLRYTSSQEVEEHNHHQKQISEHHQNHYAQNEPKSPSLCNHNKRKIPKSEDSPLISSTRDDLGDCPEKGIKKRRTSESEFSTGNPGNATPNSKESPVPSSSAIRSHVAVPCSQQSPDTTTQTPQTEMSPASSISSEPSSVTNFNTTGGSRSLRSTPTPPSSSNGKVSTPPSSKRQQGQCDFVWPPPPSITTTTIQTRLSSPNSNNTNTNVWTSPTTTTTSSSTGVSSQNNNGNNNNNHSSNKKSHHLIPKTGTGGLSKRASSPCPNIDVRQIPLEQNQPPPKPSIPSNNNDLALRIIQQQPTQFSINPQAMTSTIVTSNGNTITSSNIAGHFGLNSNANISFFPVSSTHNEMTTNLSMNLNSGFTISPIIQQAGGMRILNQPQLGQVLSSTNVPCSMPMQIQNFQKVFTGIPDCSGGNTFISQFQSPPVVLSVVGQPHQQQELQQIGTKSEESNNKATTTISDTLAEKSPLQLVQDVVDRFESKSGEERKEGNEIEKRPSSGNCSENVTGKGTNSKMISESVESDSKKAEEKKIEVDDKKKAGESCSTTSSADSKEEDKTKTAGKDLNQKSCNVTNVSNEDEVIIISEPNKVEAITTAVNTTTVSLAPMDQSTCVTTCVTNLGGNGNSLGTFTLPSHGLMNPQQQQQIVLQPQQGDQGAGAGQNFISNAGAQQMRYPIIQTIQPFFLNPGGGAGGPFNIISPSQSQGHGDPNQPQSFIYHHHQDQQHHLGQQQGDPSMQQTMLQPTTTMLFDPSLCGALAAAAGGPKKKKKRLSKKQQQQQAQLQLQQQLLLQQIQQQQAAASFPLTIFPQSFNLGPQGFSLQPMNFFQSPTILTLPNLILNPMDGTLFLQPSTPLTSSVHQQQTMKFPMGTTISSQPQQIQQQHHQNLIAPKKDGNVLQQGTTILGGIQGQVLEVGKALSDAGSDDSRRNPTPDSSTGDVQLGIINVSTQCQNQTQGNTIISIAPHPTTTATIVPAPTNNKKISIKSRAVSSSSTVKRILPQKQILPKIDSTTTTIENN